jgi:hypothetical protein
MKRKSKPIHQQARELGLPLKDLRELELFREFLRQPVQNQLTYDRIYGGEDAPTEPSPPTSPPG